MGWSQCVEPVGGATGGHLELRAPDCWELDTERNKSKTDFSHFKKTKQKKNNAKKSGSKVGVETLLEEEDDLCRRLEKVKEDPMPADSQRSIRTNISANGVLWSGGWTPELEEFLHPHREMVRTFQTAGEDLNCCKFQRRTLTRIQLFFILSSSSLHRLGTALPLLVARYH